MTSIVKEIVRSGGVRLVVLPLTGVCSLATVAIMTRYAGSSGYGAIALVSAIAVMLPFADLGLGAGVINVYSGESDAFDRDSWLASSIRWLVAVATLLAVIGVMGATLFSWSSVLGIDKTYSSSMDPVVGWSVALLGASVPLSLGQRVLIGVGKNHLVVGISVVTSVASLAWVGCVWATRSPMIFMALSGSIGVLATAFIYFVLAVRFTGFRLRTILDMSFRRRGVLAVGWWMLIVTVMVAVVFQSGRLIVAHVSDSDGLASYSMALQFYVPSVSIVAASGFAVWPLFASARAAQSYRVRGMFMRVSGILGIIGLIGGILLSVLSPIVGRVISGGKVSVSIPLAVSIGVLLFVQSLQTAPGMYLTDRCGLRFQAACASCAAMLTVIVGWLLAPIWGPVGVVAGVVAGVLAFQVIPGYLRVFRGMPRAPALSGALSVSE